MMNMMGQVPMGNMDATSDVAMQRALAAQEQAQLQARGVQQPTYQTNGVNPAFAAVTDGVMGDITARNNAMKGLI